MRTRQKELEQRALRALGEYIAVFRNTIPTTLAGAALLATWDELTDYLEDITDEAGAHNDQQTSIDAAYAAAPRVGTVRRRIIDEIRLAGRLGGNAGYTDDQLEKRLHKQHTTVSSARNWLVEHGWLCDSGLRRATANGRAAIIWTLTPAAQKRIASPEWVTSK